MENLSLADIKKNLKTRLESEGLGPFHDRSLISSLVEQFSGLLYLQNMRIEYLTKQLNMDTAEGAFLDAFGKPLNIQRKYGESDYALLQRIRQRADDPTLGSIAHYKSMAESVLPECYIHARFLRRSVDGLTTDSSPVLCMFVTTRDPENPIFSRNDGLNLCDQLQSEIQHQTPWGYNLLPFIHDISLVEIPIQLFPGDIPDLKIKSIMTLLRRTMLENYNPMGGYCNEDFSLNKRIQILPRQDLNRVLQREFGPEFRVNLHLGDLTARDEELRQEELNPENPDDDWTNRIAPTIYPLLRHPIEIESNEGT